MTDKRDVIIIGGGHNGLVTAFYLAKAGLRPLVLESRPQVGGAAITEEFYPGFRCSTLAHSAGTLQPEIFRDMRLEKYGLKLLQAQTSVTAISPDGEALTLYPDVARSVKQVAGFSARDAGKYGEFQEIVLSIAQVLNQMAVELPPNMDRLGAEDLWRAWRNVRAVRKLGKKNFYRLLRWLPMPVADLTAEFFETELLRAVIAARGVFGTALGPHSGGSGMVMLLRAAADGTIAGSNSFVEGGIGSMTQAMAAAAAEAGVEIRTDARVIEIRIEEGNASGVVLNSGEEIGARAVVSNADPKNTFLKLMSPAHLPVEFIKKIKNYRSQGTVAKVNLALSGMPEFTALADGSHALEGRIHIGPEVDYLERAFDQSKYGAFSKNPFLEVVIPTVLDPLLAPSGQHVMSVYMQYAPFKLKSNDWEVQSKSLGQAVVKTLARYAPNLPELILSHQIITPQDMQDIYGLTGGHIFHGELALDQIFSARPLLGWANYSTPIKDLFLCGSGTHPGTGLTGACGLNAAREITKAIRN